MQELHYIAITSQETGLSLYQWFKHHYPHITRGLVEKHLKKGFIRVNDKKATLQQMLDAGQTIRIHPVVLDEASTKAKPFQFPKPISEADEKMLLAAVLYKDNDMIVLNKPAGLAVQGGTGIGTSLDDLLDVLQFDASERPKLVHRLDRDTSGVLLLARSSKAAAKLTRLFREKTVEKLYWALVVGVPTKPHGKVDVPLQKKSSESGRETMQEDSNGQPALTYYEVLDKAGKEISWLALKPITGRTHQLRVHCQALGTPILGDGKYGGRHAFMEGIEDKLHLHARQITLPAANGKPITITAPPSPHMQETMKMLGFE